MDFQKLAKDICEAVGGEKNIISVNHCLSRFRITLRDDSLFQQEKIETFEGVKGIMKAGSQWQIVIGSQVPELYNAFLSQYNVTDAKKKKTIGSVFMDIGTYIQSAIGPMLYVMCGTGLIKAILSVLSLAGVMDAAGQTYTFIWGCADACFYFFPVLLAYGAAKRLNANVLGAIFIGLLMVNPTWTGIVAEGTTATLFGINVPLYSYSSQFLPILLAVPIYALIEKGLKKVVPDFLHIVIVPTVSFFVMIPVIFLVIGPFMNWLGTIIAVPAEFLAGQLWLALPLCAMLWPILTIFGIHGVVWGVLFMTYFTTLGYDPVAMVSYLCTHTAIGTVVITYAFLTKDKEEKTIGITTGITMLLGCISEPALFGVLLKNKKMFAATFAGAFVSAVYAALTGIKCYVAGINAIPIYFAAYVGPESSVVNVIITIAIAVAASVIFAVLFWNIDKIKSKKNV